MSAEPQLTGAETRLRQYRTLLEIADAITAHRDLASLLQDLTDRLRHVVEFDGVNVVLYDETRHVMRLHALSSVMLPQANLIPELPIEDAPAGWVWQTQQPMLMADLRDYEARYPRITAEMRTYGIQTAYVLPLTSAGRRLGALGFGSRQAAAYEETTREFLQQVAKLLAVAVDNALNFESAEQTRQRLARERDRLKLLLEVNNAIVAHLDLEELLHAVSTSLQAVVAHDVSGIALYDAESNQLRAHVLGSSDRASAPYFARGVSIPFEGTTGGQAFTTGQPVFVNKPDFVRFHSDYSRQIYAAGIRSGGSIPLVAHERKLGVLGVASRREDAFTQDDIDLLCQVAHQIAIAVENSLHFESARTAQQHLKRERDHTQLLLEINNAVVTSLDLRELLETISPCLRQVIHHDFAAVLLYEAESRQLRVHALDFPERIVMQGVTFSMEGTPSGIAFTERRPFLVTPRELDRFSATPLVQMLRADGVQSGCSLPLLSHDRALGVLTLMSRRADGFTEEDVPLLTQIAGQVAIAVENALNYERARAAEQEAKRQSDRLSLVLRINNAVVSQLDLQELLRVISGSLREALRHDTTGVALYDAESKQLRLVMTDFPEQMELVEESYLVPLEGTVMGLAFTSGRPVFLDEFDLERFHSDFTKRSYEAGLRSCGNIPLIAHGRKLGALGVASKRPGAFSAADIELLCQSANQIAIAVENALNFERARG